MAKRDWSPCRVCGADHNNPMSSSICSPCGEDTRLERMRQEHDERQAYEASAFGQFMSLPEDERWQAVFEHLSKQEAA